METLNKGRQKDSGNIEQGKAERQWKYRTREGRKAKEKIEGKEEPRVTSWDLKAGAGGEPYNNNNNNNNNNNDNNNNNNRISRAHFHVKHAQMR